MFEAINKFIDRLEGGAMVAFMAIATIATALQVALRFGFNISIFWIEEVVIYSIICMSFIGASMGVRYGAHITVDVLQAFVSAKGRRVLLTIGALLGVAFAGAMLYYGSMLFMNTMQRSMLSPALRIPMAWVYLPIPISGGMMIFRYLWVLRELWTNPPQSLSEAIAQNRENLV